MAFETIFGFVILAVVVVGYFVYRAVTAVNWPLFNFYQKGGF
jgi:hypothetical protein